MKAERCLKLPAPLPPPSAAARLLAGEAGRYGCFYLGEEFCEELQPAPARLAAWAGALIAAGKKVCVLTPPMDDRGLTDLERLLVLLKKLKTPAGLLELTVNDFGALDTARRLLPGAPLAAGRALYKNAFRADRSSVRVIDQRCLDGFAALGVKRFEVPLLRRGPRTNFSGLTGRRNFSLTAYHPLCSLTSARSCLLREPLTGGRCRRDCLKGGFKLAHPFIKEPLLLRGNALYLEFSGDPGPAPGPRVDRVVIENQIAGNVKEERP